VISDVLVGKIQLLAIATIHSTILWSTLGGLVIAGQVTWRWTCLDEVV